MGSYTGRGLLPTSVVQFQINYCIRMSVCRSRSSSSGRNEDSVKRDQRSSSIADEDNPTVTMTTISRSRSVSPPARPASKSPSRSKSRQRIRSRGRETSRGRNRSRGRSDLGGRARSRSKRLSSHRRPRSKRRSSKSRSRSSRRRNNEEGYRVHVADINAECRKKDLERIFMKYGPLKEIWLASYAPFYAFIVYRHRTDAEDAASGADGETIAGRRIRVSPARPRTVGPRDRFIPDKYSRDRDDNYRGRDYDRRDYDRRDSDRRDYREDRYYSRSRY